MGRGLLPVAQVREVPLFRGACLLPSKHAARNHIAILFVHLDTITALELRRELHEGYLDRLAPFYIVIPYFLVDNEDHGDVVLLSLVELLVLLSDAHPDLCDVILEWLECSLARILDAADSPDELVRPDRASIPQRVPG